MKKLFVKNYCKTCAKSLSEAGKIIFFRDKSEKSPVISLGMTF